MKAHRISAIVVRHYYLFPRSFDRITDVVFWPILDVMLWGLTSLWMTSMHHDGERILFSVMTALVFWRVVFLANYEVGANFLEECWNRNLTNIFSSPLTKWEWLAANFIVCGMKLAVVTAITAAAVWLFYSLNVFTLGWIWIPCLVLLTVTGWCVGLFASGLILHWGARAQALAWTLIFLVAPLSAVYFPMAYLPEWAKIIAYLLPTTYVFEGMRDLVLGRIVPVENLLYSLLLNVVYFACALWFFNRMFERTRARGFDHLE